MYNNISICCIILVLTLSPAVAKDGTLSALSERDIARLKPLAEMSEEASIKCHKLIEKYSMTAGLEEHSDQLLACSNSHIAYSEYQNEVQKIMKGRGLIKEEKCHNH